MKSKTAIVIGAGPAGLTAAYELLARTELKPVVVELTNEIGGISKTVNYKGNRIDIGGHRFFSKSDRVMDWWLNILPLQNLDLSEIPELHLAYQNESRQLPHRSKGLNPDREDKVMLVRKRISRIYFCRNFLDYPLKLSFDTVAKLGPRRLWRIGWSYLRVKMFPIKNEITLEHFFINRFGRELYQTFFRAYTEKVWGVPCSQLSSEWGRQRIKGLSISKALTHAVGKFFKRPANLSQKDVQTSLVETFLYPKLGPGQLWEEVAQQVKSNGGEVRMRTRAKQFEFSEGRICSVLLEERETGKTERMDCDYVFSSMPVGELIEQLPEAPTAVREIARDLVYRDFITVGVLARELRVKSKTQSRFDNGLIPDNWIYIQDPDVQVGRIQIYNNWSPYMVKDPSTVWMGLEYFCNQDDKLWSLSDSELAILAKSELEKLGFLAPDAVLDSVVIRVPKAYPSYTNGYKRFGEIRKYLDTIQNLFPIGRNGMHRYNNQDHSMLAAMAAVDNIVTGQSDKKNLWEVNTEREYNEEKIVE